MKIKICCENIKYYIGESYIRYNGKSVSIDTSVYEENEVEITHCPFCGEKIELDKGGNYE